MKPRLRQLEYIVTVHQLSSFSLAADMLNVSQTSLSSQIVAVVTDLGVRLSKRRRRCMQTTAKGLERVPRAQRILSEVESRRHVSKRWGGGLPAASMCHGGGC